jgi:hypothetical protein
MAQDQGIALDLRGDEIHSAHTELLIKILSFQQAVVSLLADKFETPVMSSDEIYKSIMKDANKYATKILEDLAIRRGHIDFDKLLDA